jgi:diguanylate cyclase (GGDEF)-like protein
MNSSELVVMLQQESPLFQRVKSSTLAAHLGDATRVKLVAGQILLVPGQRNDRVFIVLSGRLRAQLNLDEKMNPIALFGLGECVGEMSMFEDNLVSAYIVAVTDCELLSIAHPDAWAILNESLQASHNMLNILSERIRISNSALAKTMENTPGYEALDYINTVTGIYNRRWLAENTERLVHRHTVNQQPCSFILVMVDNFDQYGAQYGTLGSDQAQRTVAQVLLHCLRPNDVAAQLSESQFAVFLPQTRLEDVNKVMQRLRAEIGETTIVTPAGDSLPALSLSFGACQINAHDTLDDLIARVHDAILKH